MFRIVLAAFAALIILVANTPQAQSANGFGAPYAYVKEGQLIMVRNSGEQVPVANQPQAIAFDGLIWHAGKTLAYIAYDRNYAATVHAASLDTGVSAATHMRNLAAGYPLFFTPDGRLLTVVNGDPSTSAADHMQLYVVLVSPDVADQGTVFANFSSTVGCGGGSPYPTDRVYTLEAGFGGRPQFLALSGTLLLYTPGCGGGGLEMLNLDTGERTLLDDVLDAASFITNPALSPDGRWLAAVRNRVDGNMLKRTLILIELATGRATDLSGGENVEVVTWSVEGDALYYSTRAATRTLNDLVRAAVNERPNQYLSEMLAARQDIPEYEVTVNRLKLATGETSELYRNADAWAVGRITELSDGAVAFSVIGGLRDWLNAIASGKLDVTKEDEAAQMQWVSVNVYRVHNSETRLVCAGCTQFTVAK